MMIPLLELCQQLSKSERGGARGRGFDLSGALNLPTFCSNSAQNIAECAVLLTSAPERPPPSLPAASFVNHSLARARIRSDKCRYS